MKKQIIKNLIVLLIIFSISLPASVGAFSAGSSQVPVGDKDVQNSLVSSEDVNNGGLMSGISSILGSIFGSDVSSAVNSISKAVNKTLDGVRLAYAGVETLQCASALTNSQSASMLLGLNNLNNPTYWSSQLGPNIISSPASMAQNMSNAMNALNSMQNCINGQVTILRKVVPSTVAGGQKMQAMLDDYTKMMNTINSRRDTLSKQLQSSQTGYWKNQTVQQLSNLSKSTTKNLFNNVTNNYKIKDFNNYTNSVAGLVYTKNSIKATAPGNSVKQMALQKYTSGSSTPGSISPAVRAQADLFVGQKPSQVGLDDKDFYSKMFLYGSNEGFPLTADIAARDKAATAQGVGVSAATQEVAQSSGYKAPRNCYASDPNAALEQKFQQVSSKVDYQLEQLTQLENDRDIGNDYTQDDLDKAQADYDAAVNEMNSLTKQYPDGLVAQCDRIVAPAETVKTVAADAAANYTSDYSNWNDNDLLGYSSRIASTTNAIYSDMIFGGDVPDLAGTGGEVLGASTNVSVLSVSTTGIRGPAVHTRGE